MTDFEIENIVMIDQGLMVILSVASMTISIAMCFPSIIELLLSNRFLFARIRGEDFFETWLKKAKENKEKTLNQLLDYCVVNPDVVESIVAFIADYDPEFKREFARRLKSKLI